MASITLYTAVDTTGAVADTQKLSAEIQTALKNGDVALARHTQSWLSASQSIEVYSARVEQLMAEYGQLQVMQPVDNGSIMFQNYQNGLQIIDQTIARLNVLQEQMDIMSATGQGNIAPLVQEYEALTIKLENTSAAAADMRLQLLNAQGVDVEARTEALTNRIIQQKEALQSVTNRANIARTSLEQYSNTGSLVDKLTTKFSNLGSMITRTLTRVAIYATLAVGLRTLIKTIGNVVMSNDSFRTSLYRLQAALWTAFAPIMNYVVPVLKYFIDVLTLVITTVVRLIALLTGKSYDSMVANGKALKQQSDAYKDVGKSSGSAAKGMKKATKEAKNATKEIKKELAAFDDLQILSQDKMDMDEEETPDVGDAGAAGGAGGDAGFDMGAFQSLTDSISSELAFLMGVAGGALAAIGLILLFTGHIGWGISFIIAGAAMLAVSLITLSNKEDLTGEISTQLLYIMGVAGLTALAIGLILLFNGVWSWGIGFIVAGASALSVTAIAASKSNDAQGIINMLSIIMGAAGGALLALGIILLWIGGVVSKGIAIGMIVAGASLLVSAVSLQMFNTGEISNWLMTIMAIASGALLALGVILCMVGSTAIGIAMIVAGASALVAPLALNSEWLTTTLQGTLGAITAIASAALLALGVILVCTGVATPLGIGLIVAGAAGLAATVTANWDFIVNKVKEICEKVKKVSSDVWKWLVDKASAAWEGIKKAWSGTVNWFKNVWDSIKKEWTPVKEWFSKLFSDTWNAIKEAWKDVVNWFKTVWDGIALVFSVVKQVLEGDFSSAWEGIKSIWDNVIGYFQSVWDGIALVFSVVETTLSNYFLSALDGIKEVWDTAQQYFQRVWNEISTVFSVVEETLKSYFSSAWDRIKEVFSFNTISSYFSSVWGWIKAEFKFSEMKDVGKNIVEGIWQGIINTKDWLLNKIKSFASTITQGIKDFFGIESPSKVFRDEVGKNLMLGMAEGITGNENAVSQAMAKVEQSLSNISLSIPAIAAGNVLPYYTNASSSQSISPIETTPKSPVTETTVIKEEHYHLNETELMTILHKLVKGGERLQGTSLIS